MLLVGSLLEISPVTEEIGIVLSEEECTIVVETREERSDASVSFTKDVPCSSIKLSFSSVAPAIFTISPFSIPAAIVVISIKSLTNVPFPFPGGVTVLFEMVAS